MEDLLIGVFIERKVAKAAIADLKKIGYNLKNISIITKNIKGNKSFKNLIGLLTGVEELLIPGIGHILISGPVAADIRFTEIIFSGIAGILKRWGVSYDEAKAYERFVRQGGILLIVPIIKSKENMIRKAFNKYKIEHLRSVHVV